MSHETEDINAPKELDVIVMKRPRGRPPKPKPVSEEVVEKRPPGRPRIYDDHQIVENRRNSLKQYYERNKDYWVTRNVHVECLVCNCQIKKANISKHSNTLKHLSNLKISSD
jgi:hypothetical protein